jgi:hypothetical protein
MKFPKWDGSGPTSYIFGVVCFSIGMAVLAIFTLGQVKYVEDGPAWKFFSVQPDKKVGVSELGAMLIGIAAVALFGWLISQIRS